MLRCAAVLWVTYNNPDAILRIMLHANHDSCMFFYSDSHVVCTMCYKALKVDCGSYIKEKKTNKW